ncbi:hypothetical protein [Klebsiella pneumoniae]|uniref:hypothetical protein n=1 Tax=Klebsiella pneumoniae TaxID=573 RepID=UPI001296EC84|nr:hypothetical protein [Klebsiella pneumoniae]MQT24067.1 hypothetical protein [Klebsiella pneumoniae subsp. pneumoniae]
MSFTKTIEFANYTLNFGEDKVLLDAFDCIVFPSFFAQKYVRKFKDTEYFFTDTKIITLDTTDSDFIGPIVPTIALCGRIIKRPYLNEIKYFKMVN